MSLYVVGLFREQQGMTPVGIQNLLNQCALLNGHYTHRVNMVVVRVLSIYRLTRSVDQAEQA